MVPSPMNPIGMIAFSVLSIVIAGLDPAIPTR
jgi:hypothetical protein